MKFVKSVKKYAATSGNLKGTHKRFQRDAAGNSQVCVTEMTSWNTTAGNEAAPVQKNMQHIARIQLEESYFKQKMAQVMGKE